MLRVTSCSFNDHNLGPATDSDIWRPEDPSELSEWITILVGKSEGEGHWFQVQLCTHRAIANVDRKEYLFQISYWEGLEDLIAKLNKFISDTLPEHLNLDDENDYGLAMQNLSKYWLWEYSNYA